MNTNHGRFPYSPIPFRPALRLPGGARVAVWLVINVEHYSFHGHGTCLFPVPGSPPDVLNYAWRDYGPRVGFWRLMDILDRLRVRASVTINAEACLRYPQIVEEAKKRSWEFLGHGRTNSELLRGLPQEEERGLIKQCIDAITATTGQAPRGWLGPALAESDFTPDLLAEAGITYVCDWCNDDQPYWMRTTSGRLMSVPYSIEINDIPAVLGLGKSSEEFCKMVRDQFDVLHAEGQRAARVMAVALHPFIMGQPFRSLHLENVLQYIVAQEGVWMTTGGEIADWFAGASGSI